MFLWILILAPKWPFCIGYSLWKMNNFATFRNLFSNIRCFFSSGFCIEQLCKMASLGIKLKFEWFFEYQGFFCELFFLHRTTFMRLYTTRYGDHWLSSLKDALPAIAMPFCRKVVLCFFATWTIFRHDIMTMTSETLENTIFAPFSALCYLMLTDDQQRKCSQKVAPHAG